MSATVIPTHDGGAARSGETLHCIMMQSPWTAWRNSDERRKKRGGVRPGRVDGQRKEEEAQTLWGMLYADDAGIASRSPEGLEKMMTVIVTACAAFGLTV